MVNFNDLGIIDPILKALRLAGYKNPTPIQEKAIPLLLEGKDLLGGAQTGTGKTAAFAIPILQHLSNAKHYGRDHRKIRALVVAPTRELAIQIGKSFTVYGRFTGLRTTTVFGGVKQNMQVRELKRGVDILVATPGRLLDLNNQGFISFRDIDHCVLDEADRMLDMGFIHDIRRIISKLPENRQSLFFSATLPPEIKTLAGKMLGPHETITIAPKQTTAEKIEQAIYRVDKKSKSKLLLHLLTHEINEAVLVFSRTKHGANKIVRILGKQGLKAEAIHGNKSQGARQKALKNFKTGSTRILVATDIASRGIDINDLAYVINYDLPNIPETYVHRIGRTGRANKTGLAISFCDISEVSFLRDIEKLLKQQLNVIVNHPFPAELNVAPAEEKAGKTPKSSYQQGRRKYYRKKRRGNRSFNASKASS